MQPINTKTMLKFPLKLYKSPNNWVCCSNQASPNKDGRPRTVHPSIHPCLQRTKILATTVHLKIFMLRWTSVRICDDGPSTSWTDSDDGLQWFIMSVWKSTDRWTVHLMDGGWCMDRRIDCSPQDNLWQIMIIYDRWMEVQGRTDEQKDKSRPWRPGSNKTWTDRRNYRLSGFETVSMSYPLCPTPVGHRPYRVEKVHCLERCINVSDLPKCHSSW